MFDCFLCGGNIMQGLVQFDLLWLRRIIFQKQYVLKICRVCSIISGGVPSSIWSSLPHQVQSHHGYEGCLASLDLGGEAPNLVTDAVLPSTEVIGGCDGNLT